MNKIKKMLIKNFYYNITLFTLAININLHKLPEDAPVPKFEEEQTITEDNLITIEKIKISYDAKPHQNNIANVYTIKKPEELITEEPKELIIEAKEYSGTKLTNEFEDEIKRIAKLYGITIEKIKISYDDQPHQNNIVNIYTVEEPEELIIEEKEYSGMKLSHEFEDEIKRIAKLYDVPYQIILAIGYRESAGNWNNNGVISKTDDYGVFQINECNLDYIHDKLGFTKEEILNDPIKNAEACIYLVKRIIDRDDVDTIEEVFGMYNGWSGWREKERSVGYSNGCCEIINEYFPDFQYSESQITK